MAQIRNFTSTNDSYFVLDGVSYPKVYEAMLDNGYTKDRVKLVGTNRDSSPLVFSTHYSNIRVDGASFASANAAISRLNQVVFSKGGGSGDGGTGIQSIQEGDNISIDNTDPLNPIVSATITETDPIFTESPAHSITNQNIIDWNKQSDWNQTNTDAIDFIKNKPNLTDLNCWGLSGNSETTASNFIGTINNIPLVFKVNNFKSGIFSLHGPHQLAQKSSTRILPAYL